MSGRVRVYELSKELGIDNQVCLDLCHALNIGGGDGDLKISSSLMAAQAERVRRRAERDGLVSRASDSAVATATATNRRTQRRPPSRRPRRERPARTARPSGRTGRNTTVGRTGRDRISEAVEELDGEATQQAIETVVETVSTPEIPETQTTEQETPERVISESLSETQEAGPEVATSEAAEFETAEVVPSQTDATEPAAAEVVDKAAESAAERAASPEASSVISAQPTSPETDATPRELSESPSVPTAQDAKIPAAEAEPLAASAASTPTKAKATESNRQHSPTTSKPKTGRKTSQVISSDDARQKISSRPDPARANPVSPTGKPIPPPPGRSRAIMVDGKVLVPGTTRGRSRPSRTAPGQTPSEASPAARRRQPRRAASRVDAVFTPQKTRMPTSPQGGKGKTGKGSSTQFRPAPRRRKGSRRRRRSVEDLRPLDQRDAISSLASAPVPQEIVEIARHSTAQQIAPLLNRTPGDMVKYFMDQNEMIAAAKPLSDDLIELYAEDIGARVKIVDLEQEHEAELQELLELPAYDEEDEQLSPRPPIVTVMGHVDHGKTTLLDAIRETNVVSDEAGGITQHIGAYHVERNGHSVTFIDTPGHEAFTAMRTRGANITDLVVLVVAADDGLMPQTEEAIAHAKAAEVPILVAINKMDKEGVNPDRVRQQLSEKGLVPEAWGGETVMEEISALNGNGLESLLESILLQAEIQELVAPEEQRATGVVLESHKDIGRGPVATLLVLEGTLKVGDPVVAGAVWGRVRALLDENGKKIKAVGPSTPVQVLGLSDVAVAGDEFAVAPSQRVAEKVGSARAKRLKASDLGRDIGARAVGARLEDIFTSISAGETVTLNLVIKADVHGSMEALASSLKKLERDHLKLSFVRQGVGGITENDVQLALASNATIVGFNVRPDSNSRQLAVKEDVDVRLYEVIYKVTEDVENALLGMLKPEIEERVTGEAEVRQIFRISKVGKVAGCYVSSGAVRRGSQVRFLRDGTIIWRGAIKSLKRFEADANEVLVGQECGIGLSDFQDLKPGDIIETFEEHEIARG